jgi:hypothetical protein
MRIARNTVGGGSFPEDKSGATTQSAVPSGTVSLYLVVQALRARLVSLGPSGTNLRKRPLAQFNAILWVAVSWLFLCVARSTRMNSEHFACALKTSQLTGGNVTTIL